MAITGYESHADQPDEIFFTTTTAFPREAKRVRWLLLVALVTSVWSAAVNANLAMKAFSASTTLQDGVIRAVEDETGPVRVALDDPEFAKSVLSVAGVEVEGELTEEQLKLRIQQTRDASAILRDTCADLMLLFMGLTIYFPFKYLVLWWRVGRGHPETYRNLRGTAFLQFATEALRMYVIYDVTQHAYALEIPNPISASMLLAVIMLLYLRSKKVQAYFSHFVVKRAPSGPAVEDAQPAS
ncbi:hypothetical protein OAX78_03795 [Planctomycetota bacterium]|nr:hypothetical protein [Planctomycetota bacterium]